MLRQMKHTILLFESVHKVMKADQLLTLHHFRFDIIPTPKDHSTDCGLSIRIHSSGNELSLILSMLSAEGLQYRVVEVV
jgi:hypothetical protein